MVVCSSFHGLSTWGQPQTKAVCDSGGLPPVPNESGRTLCNPLADRLPPAEIPRHRRGRRRLDPVCAARSREDGAGGERRGH